MKTMTKATFDKQIRDGKIEVVDQTQYHTMIRKIGSKTQKTEWVEIKN